MNTEEFPKEKWLNEVMKQKIYAAVQKRKKKTIHRNLTLKLLSVIKMR